MKKAKVLATAAVVAAMTASTFAGCGSSSVKETADQSGNAAADELLFRGMHKSL